MTPSLTSLSNPLSLSRTVTRFPLALTLSLIFPDHNGSIYFTLALTKPSLPLSPCFPLSLSPLIHRHAILSHSALFFYVLATPALSSFTLTLTKPSLTHSPCLSLSAGPLLLLLPFLLIIMASSFVLCVPCLRRTSAHPSTMPYRKVRWL